MQERRMGSGNVIYSSHLDTQKPISYMPRYFAYIHTVADSPSYFSEGRLRLAEEHCIFHYTLRGHGICWNETGRSTVSPGQGFLEIINDPESGYCYPDGQTEEWEFQCFCFEGESAMKTVRDLISAYGQVYTVPPDSRIIQDLGNEKNWRKELPLSAFDSSRYFYELFGELVRSVSGRENMQYNKLIQSTKQIIQEQLLSNPSIDQIASDIGLSREHLSRLFHSETGTKLKDYIRNERIVAACRMLKDTNLTVQEIAELMHCSSSANFIRFFNKTMKMTPSAFRQRGTIPVF